MDASQSIAGPTGLGEKRFGSMALLVNAKRSASTATRSRRSYAPPPQRGRTLLGREDSSRSFMRLRTRHHKGLQNSLHSFGFVTAALATA